MAKAHGKSERGNKARRVREHWATGDGSRDGCTVHGYRARAEPRMHRAFRESTGSCHVIMEYGAISQLLPEFGGTVSRKKAIVLIPPSLLLLDNIQFQPRAQKQVAGAGFPSLHGGGRGSAGFWGTLRDGMHRELELHIGMVRRSVLAIKPASRRQDIISTAWVDSATLFQKAEFYCALSCVKLADPQSSPLDFL
ncbi:hypothetical protein ABZP36_015869 [Zizania latifolia]